MVRREGMRLGDAGGGLRGDGVLWFLLLTGTGCEWARERNPPVLVGTEEGIGGCACCCACCCCCFCCCCCSKVLEDGIEKVLLGLTYKENRLVTDAKNRGEREEV